MLSDSILSALNAQITQEKFASQVYLSMSAWFANQNLNGFSKYLKEQSKEENEHALKFFCYILKQQGRIMLEGLEFPKTSWDNPIAAFEDVLALEQHVTSLINNLMKLAVTENDFATQSMLQWFVDEQVKSEFEAHNILEKLLMIGDDMASIIMLDDELEPAQNTGDFWNIKSDENV